MNTVNIPYHLIIPCFISLIVLVIIGIRRKVLFQENKRRWLWISVTVFFGFYLLKVGLSAFLTIYYQIELNSYDLNQDGFFSGNEITPGQEVAMQKVVSDVGRNFSFITGGIYALVLATITFIIGKVVLIINRKKLATTTGISNSSNS